MHYINKEKDPLFYDIYTEELFPFDFDKGNYKWESPLMPPEGVTISDFLRDLGYRPVTDKEWYWIASFSG